MSTRSSREEIALVPKDLGEVRELVNMLNMRILRVSSPPLGMKSYPRLRKLSFNQKPAVE